MTGAQLDFEIRQLAAGDAKQLGRCFERCYGRTYSNETFYDPVALADLITRGGLRSVIAVAADGNIVGHTGLTIRSPDATVCEAGNTVVDPDWRGAGVLGRMGGALSELCQQSGFVGYVHYPTTAHDVMQKRSVSSGGVETGVMLGYIPADTDYRDIDQGSGRIAATIAYQPISDHPIDMPPVSIYVPQRYEMMLGRLYGQTGLRRERLRSPGQPRQSTDVGSVYNPKRGLLSLQIRLAGADLTATIEESMAAAPAEITHVDLCLDEPGIDQAVNDLADLGFVYCGLLPGFASSDVLRLQRLRDQPPGVFAPELANPVARSILAFIDSERQADSEQ
jgi:hypothetical protein